MDTSTSRPTWIIHADLDAFFASLVVLRQPELAGKPVIVGGSPDGRGVVTSATYEARLFGVRSAMPAAQAARLCPEAIFVRTPGEDIREYANRFRDILRQFSPLVEVVSVDEAYLDASHSDRLYGGAIQLGQQLKQRVKDDLGLVVSLGIASNRLVAKIASDLGKPDGFTVVPQGQEEMTLAPLSVDWLPGIGPKACVKLHSYGIRTLGDLARAPESVLFQIAGRNAGTLRKRARGEYSWSLSSDRGARKSVGHERTFFEDLNGIEHLRKPLYNLCERTGAELRQSGLVATTVSLKLRYNDFTTLTRQQSLADPTDAHQELYDVAISLLRKLLAQRSSPVRLIGVRASGLLPFRMQLGLFDHGRQRTRNLNQALDNLADRHGGPILKPASVVFEHERR